MKRNATKQNNTENCCKPIDEFKIAEKEEVKYFNYVICILDILVSFLFQNRSERIQLLL